MLTKHVGKSTNIDFKATLRVAMLRYTIRRLLWGVLVIFAVTLAVFVLFGPVLQSRSNINPAPVLDTEI